MNVFKCPCCGEITTDEYVKSKGKAGEIGSQMMAVIADGKRGRIYLTPDEDQIIAAEVPRPEDCPDGSMPGNPRWFSPPGFGMTEYSDLFTNRQLTAMLTLSNLVIEAQKKVEQDAISAGMHNDHISISEGGKGARAYGEAVSVYEGLRFNENGLIMNKITFKKFDYDHYETVEISRTNMPSAIWETDLFGNKSYILGPNNASKR